MERGDFEKTRAIAGGIMSNDVIKSTPTICTHTETARAILSYKGVLLKKHLLQGVAKGALTEAEAEKKHKAWMEEQAKRVDAKVSGLNKAKEEAKNKRHAAEKEAKEAKEKKY